MPLLHKVSHICPGTKRRRLDDECFNEKTRVALKTFTSSMMMSHLWSSCEQFGRRSVSGNAAVAYVTYSPASVLLLRSVTESEPNFLNIAPLDYDLQPTSTDGLTNYQKRLVHQLVRAEFPDLVSVGKPTFVQIIPHVQEREEALKETRRRRLDERLSRQIGLRWLVEAMVRGDTSGIDEKSLARGIKNEAVFIDPDAMGKRMKAIREALESRPTVLVGHNLFVDLVCFYRTFIGPLPNLVEDFQRAIHALFPL